MSKVMNYRFRSHLFTFLFSNRITNLNLKKPRRVTSCDYRAKLSLISVCCAHRLMLLTKDYVFQLNKKVFSDYEIFEADNSC